MQKAAGELRETRPPRLAFVFETWRTAPWLVMVLLPQLPSRSVCGVATYAGSVSCSPEPDHHFCEHMACCLQERQRLLMAPAVAERAAEAMGLLGPAMEATAVAMAVVAQ